MQSLAIEDQPDTAARLLEIVGRLAVELHPRRRHPVTLDSQLERDLGLDSLGRVELLARIEKEFGVALPEHVFAEVETPRDLARALASARRPGAIAAPMEERAPALAGIAGTPDHAQTLVDVLSWHVRQHADRPHVQLCEEAGEEPRITYGDLWAGAQRIAVGLQHRGLALGDKVALMLPTGFDYLYTFFGIVLAGGVPVPIYPPTRMSQIEDHLRRHSGILENSMALYLVTVPQAKGVGKLLKSTAPGLKQVLTRDDLVASGELQLPAIGPQDTAFLQYTSGSTGNPKGVVLTHANLLANIRAMGGAIDASASDVFVSWLPLYHDMGLIGAWLGSLYYGVFVVLMSPLAFLARPSRWLRAIHRYRATLSAAPNFGYEFCLKHMADEELKGLDLSSWRIAFNGAEPVSPDTLHRFHARLAPNGFRWEALMPVYGLAENSVGLAFPEAGHGPLVTRIQRDTFMREGRAEPAATDDPHALQMVSCGHPLPGHEVRVVDDNGRELPEAHEGHLQFRGPSATSGYYRSPEKTRALFDGDWLETGDMGYIANGEIYISGRSKDIIIRAGRNIYPQELEEAVGNIPGVRKGCVAVIGARDRATATERLVVIAETRETDPVKIEQLREQVSAATFDLMGVPCDDVVLAPPHAVLKTSSGKIRRAACSESYEQGRLGGAPRPVWVQLGHVVLAALRPGLHRLRRSLSGASYAAYAWTVFWLLTPAAWLAAALLPRPAWVWPIERVMARALARLAGIRISVTGLANAATDKPVVLVANHASYIDGIALVASLPRPVSLVAKAEFRQGLIARVFLSRMGAEFVERFDLEASSADARRLTQRTRAERPLLFFAEGTFTRVPGLRPFHLGAFMAAAESGVPVIPIALRGTRSILRNGSWFPRHGTIHIVIGEPVDPAALALEARGDPWHTAIALRDRTREHILRHCGEPDLAGLHGGF
jgi:acyl carrier protein